MIITKKDIINETDTLKLLRIGDKYNIDFVNQIYEYNDSSLLEQVIEYGNENGLIALFCFINDAFKNSHKNSNYRFIVHTGNYLREFNGCDLAKLKNDILEAMEKNGDEEIDLLW